MIDAAAKSGDARAANTWVARKIAAGFRHDVVGGNAALESATASTGKHSGNLPHDEVGIDLDGLSVSDIGEPVSPCSTQRSLSVGSESPRSDVSPPSAPGSSVDSDPDSPWNLWLEDSCNERREIERIEAIAPDARCEEDVSYLEAFRANG